MRGRSARPAVDAAACAGEVKIDAHLVRRLVTAQFPQWAHLPIESVRCSGWDNRVFHLGEHMAVRLPSAAHYSLQVAKEQRWLPRLAPLLPLPIPVPLAMGMPAEGYPWHWSIYKWIEGEIATIERIGDLNEFAAGLAGFLSALQRIDAADGPAPGLHNFFRGGPLAIYDSETRKAIASLGDEIDADGAMVVWEAALAAKRRSSPVWLHGDVSAGNLLIECGRLCGVIDFGCCGVGDPACDLPIAWTLLEGESRDVFRAGLALDDATWARGRGWTLWKGLITLAQTSQNQGANPHDAAESRRVIDAVLADHERTA